MKAMLLAAGRGERMGPLTDNQPKPLIQLAGKPIITHLIERLAGAGIRDLVINHAWHGEQIVKQLGNGSTLGVNIHYSPEPPGALNTGGGIFKALALLGDGPFLVCNADIWTDYDFSRLPGQFPGPAHLIMVDNPAQHPVGDFVFRNGQVLDIPGDKLTFSGIGLYRAGLFKDCRAGAFALAPLLRLAMSKQPLSGEHFTGRWHDLGTPQRLAELEHALSGR